MSVHPYYVWSLPNEVACCIPHRLDGNKSSRRFQPIGFCRRTLVWFQCHDSSFFQKVLTQAENINQGPVGDEWERTGRKYSDMNMQLDQRVPGSVTCNERTVPSIYTCRWRMTGDLQKREENWELMAALDGVTSTFRKFLDVCGLLYGMCTSTLLGYSCDLTYT